MISFRQAQSSRGLSALLGRVGGLIFVAFLLMIGPALLGSDAWAACSTDRGKVTINEYNNLGSNNTLGGSYVEVKLLPVPVGLSLGQAPLTDVAGWILKSYTKNGNLQGTQPVSSAAIGGCTGTPYRATTISLSGSGDGYVHLLDAVGNLVDALYLNVTVPTTATLATASCSLSTITTDKDIQGADANRKNVSRDPDGTGTWVMSLGGGSNSEQTLCADNRDLLRLAKSSSASSMYAGETVTFTMTVTNSTQFTTLSNVTVIDSLPAGFTRTNYTAPAGSTTFNTSTNTWTVTTMVPGASYILTLTARADQAGNLVNSATAYVIYGSSSNPYTYQSNDATASVTVNQPLTLTKTVSPTSVSPGAAAVFSVTVTNNSTAALPASFAVNDTVPIGLTAGTPTTTSGSSYNNSTGVWTINSAMAAGSSQVLTLPVTAPATPGSFTNTATAVTPFGGANLTASATLTVGTVSNFNAFETSTAASATSGRIFTKLAGTPFNLDVVVVAGGSQSTGFSGNVKVELLANTGTSGSGYGSDNCPTSNSVAQAIASTAIAGGRSMVNFAAVVGAYRDVRVRISYPTISPTIIICSTDSFAIRPQVFTITSTNATNSATSGTPVIKAGGGSFNLTATAVTGYNSTPSLDAAKVIGSSTAGTLSGSFGAASGGVAEGNTFTYSEVGNFGLSADAVYDISFTSLDQGGDCVASSTSNALSSGKYGCWVGSNAVAQTTGSSGFGRFIPDHFNTTVLLSGSVPMTCPTGLTCPILYNGFVYAGQPFSVQVTAKNASDVTTVNYDTTTGFAKSTALTAFGAKGAMTSPTGAGTLGAPSVTAFAAGTLTESAEKFTFTTTPTAPTAIYIRASDAEASSLRASNPTTTSVEGGVQVVSGRIHIPNVYGSELLPLPMTATVQYYSGTNWVTSTTDSTTAFNSNLSTAGGNLVAAVVSGLGGGVVVGSPGTSAVAAGVRTLTLNAPGVPGSANMSLNAPIYLPSVTGRATFGIYKNRLIYRRENY